MKKGNIIRFFVFVFIILAVFIMLVSINSYNSKNSKNEIQTNFSSVEELFISRYKKHNINYRYIEADNFYFVSISKKSMFTKIDTYELIYANQDDSMLEYYFLYDGIDIDIKTVYDKFISLDFSTENFNSTNPYLICYIKEYKGYYAMFFIDNNPKATGDIINVTDSYGDFMTIESVDFGLQYYFKIVNKENVTDEYKVQCELKDVGVKSFGKEEIEETFKAE